MLRAEKANETAETVCAPKTNETGRVVKIAGARRVVKIVETGRVVKMIEIGRDVSALKIFANARRLQTATMPMGRDKTHSPTSMMSFKHTVKSADSDIKL